MCLITTTIFSYFTLFFFFNDTATTEIYTLSLHDALPIQPSKELAGIIGTDESTRGEVTKKVWEYIKKHDLQNPDNRRQIVPDEKLSKVFGNKEPIDMMKLAGILTPHLKK